MSEIKVNSIKGVAASSAAITVDNSSGSASANLTTVNSVVMPNGGSFANRRLTINGDMRIAQRGASSTTNGYNTVDRFAVNFDSGLTEAPTQAQVALSSSDTPYSSGFRYALKITNGNQTSQDANDYIQIAHKIEAQDIAQSGWNYTSSSSNITLSFWVKASIAQTMYVRLNAEDTPGSNARAFSFAFSATTSWTKITKTIPGNSTLVFNNDNGVGIALYIIPYYGTNYTTSGHTNDAWVVDSGSDQVTDMANTWFSGNDATLEVTGVQLEVGSVVTDFEHLTYGDELRRCQRYFYKTYRQGITPGTASQVADITSKRNQDYNSGRTDHEFNAYYSVPMRATPTLTFYSYAGTENKFTNANVDFSGATEGTITGTVYHGRKKLSHISMADSVGGGKFCFFHFTASAEI